MYIYIQDGHSWIIQMPLFDLIGMASKSQDLHLHDFRCFRSMTSVVATCFVQIGMAFRHRKIPKKALVVKEVIVGEYTIILSKVDSPTFG